jgi:membrane fusion protein, multidrug efflux system
MTDVSKRGWSRWWWLALLAVVGVGLAAKAIIQRKTEQQQLVQASTAPAQQALRLSQGDLVVATRMPLNTTVPISGSVMAVDRVVLKSRVSGEVLSLTVREGDAVKKGQLLGRVDAADYRSRLEQARQQANSARAQWQIAQRALDNNRALVDQGFISKNALDTSMSNAASAKANLQAAEAAAHVARKALDDTQLVSPLNGLVSQQFVQAGERVAVDARVLEVVNLARMEMETSLKPEDVAQVQVGAQARLNVDGLTAPLTAQVTRINPSADAVSRAVTIYLSVPPQPALRHGLFAQGQLLVGSAEALAVPASVVRRQAKGAFVQILAGQGADQKVVHRPVQLGATGVSATPGLAEVPMVSVLSGLSAGDRVLRGSLGLLREGTAVELVPGR